MEFIFPFWKLQWCTLEIWQQEARMLPVGGKIECSPTWAIACSDFTETLPCMALEPWLSFHQIKSSLNPLSVSPAAHSINDHSCSTECLDSNGAGAQSLWEHGTHSLPSLKTLGLNFRFCSQCHIGIPASSCWDNLVNSLPPVKPFGRLKISQQTLRVKQSMSHTSRKRVTFLSFFFFFPYSWSNFRLKAENREQFREQVQRTVPTWQSSYCVEAEDVTHNKHEPLGQWEGRGRIASLSGVGVLNSGERGRCIWLCLQDSFTAQQAVFTL